MNQPRDDGVPVPRNVKPLSIIGNFVKENESDHVPLGDPSSHPFHRVSLRPSDLRAKEEPGDHSLGLCIV